MKMLLIFLTAVVVTGLVFAQGHVSVGGNFSRYTTKMRPPVSLPEAYALALREIGPATNQFHCIAADCKAGEVSNPWVVDGWKFTFSNTNDERGEILVTFAWSVLRGSWPQPPAPRRLIK